MFTYISGSQIDHSGFPKEFWDELNRIMNDGDEILLGDSAFEHRVYTRCRNRQYEKLSITKDVLHGSIKTFSSNIASRIPARMNMYGKCDRMIAIWDGESEDVFADMLMILSLHKKCILYYLPAEERVEIVDPGDLIPLVPEREGWTTEDIRSVLKTCGFKEQMMTFLLSKGIPREATITEIINKAPVSLTEKLDMLVSLRKKNDLKYIALQKVSGLIRSGADNELIKGELLDVFGPSGIDIDNSIERIQKARFALKNCMLYLFDEWYDTDVFMVKSEPVGMFDSLKRVMEYISREDEYDNEDTEERYKDSWWYRLEAWNIPYGNWGEELEHTYNFYIYKGEICWFELMRADKEDNGITYYMPYDRELLGGALDLSVETPYKAGDIVNIDCRPFGPPFHAVITEGNDQWDCCMPQIFFKIPFTDQWEITALKHRHFFKENETHTYEPILSPLYRLRKIRSDELTGDDDLLVKISNILEGDDDKGAFFEKAWDVFQDSDHRVRTIK